MDFTAYQLASRETAIYPQSHLITYPALGLAGEVGELCNKVKKIVRDYEGSLTRSGYKGQLKAELGDILWYLSQVASDAGLSLDEIATENLTKLADRKKRGTIGGDGDER